MLINPYLNHEELRRKFRRKKVIANIIRFLFIISIIIAFALKSLEGDSLFGYSTLNWLTAIIAITIISMIILFLNGMCPACKDARSLFFDSNICRKCKFDFSLKNNNNLSIESLQSNNSQTSPDNKSISEQYKLIFSRQEFILGFIIILIVFVVGLQLTNPENFFGVKLVHAYIICGILFVLSLALSVFNWRCPSCKSSLGNKKNPIFCPSCKIILRP